MRISKFSAIAATALLLALPAEPAVVEPGQGRLVRPGQGVEFSQVDWTFPGAEQLDSPYGLFAVDFERLGRATRVRRGYLNVATVDGWVVRNLPLLPDLRCGGLSTFFDLGSEGDVTTLFAAVDLSPQPLTTFTLGSADVATFAVGEVTINAQGRNGLAAVPPGPPPALQGIAFLPGGLISGVAQEGHPSVEQDKNQCGPGSVANSLQWLEDEYGIDVPHDHVPGIEGDPDDSLVGQLDETMDRAEGETVGDEDAIEGKLAYIDGNDLADDLVVKHWGGTFVSGDRTVGDVTSEDQSTDGLTLFAWILRELEAGEDVELALGYAGGGGHWVDVVAAGHVLGLPWIAWVHDGEQGKKGGTKPDDGGAVWTLVVDGKAVGYRDATLDFAMSESPQPTTDACLPSDTVLCIDAAAGDRRFEVTVDFFTVQGGGAEGSGQALELAPLGVEQGGLFSFFDRGNPEVVVKVLEACPVNGHYWVFVTAGTNVGLDVRVVDTATGATFRATNPDLNPAAPVQDTAAFPCVEGPNLPTL
jgi:hypothetical protein